MLKELFLKIFKNNKPTITNEHIEFDEYQLISKISSQILDTYKRPTSFNSKIDNFSYAIEYFLDQHNKNKYKDQHIGGVFKINNMKTGEKWTVGYGI